MYVFTYNCICMVIGRKWQQYDVDGNNSSAVRTRHVIIKLCKREQLLAEVSEARVIDHVGVPKSGNVNGEKYTRMRPCRQPAARRGGHVPAAVLHVVCFTARLLLLRTVRLVIAFPRYIGAVLWAPLTSPRDIYTHRRRHL